ncbi:MAG: hypothetical protein GWO87_01585 [Xanthomonadaceae bacterium]|nr:hypothetical protein [Rhodospirillaceae bacterium]NIA17864.1 hypothetical protein [Xanthomonadaceae bacterium]
MDNSTLSKKADNLLTVSSNIKKIFQIIYQEQNKEKDDEDEIPKIIVSELVSKMAFYYEKIRNSVDYEEEHLLRKNAIKRILKRQIVIEGAVTIKKTDNYNVAKHLLVELIRAAYLPNNSIPENRIDEISRILERYLKLKEYSLRKLAKYEIKERNNFSNWIVALMASDIEEKFSNNPVNSAVIADMHEILVNNINLPDDSKYKKDKEIQIYIGIYRNFLKFDKDMLNFLLFKYYNINWDKFSDDEIKKVADNILFLRARIEKQINHPLTFQIDKIISRYTVFFKILIDVIAENPVKVYEELKKNPNFFERKIKNVCNKKYSISRKKLWRAAIRSIIYIFITKSVIAFILEIPVSKFFKQEISLYSLIINISFPAVLLFLIVLFFRLPSDNNTNKIIQGVEEIVFEEKKRKKPFYFLKHAKRSRLLNSIFGIIYFISFFLSFSIVVWGLNKIGFNWISIIIFLFFFTLVSFFSVRIRKNAKELVVIPAKENILSFIAEFFYIPIISTGKWLSNKFSQINVFVFILDFIIEAPFKVFVSITEEWTKYVKERKDEII